MKCLKCKSKTIATRIGSYSWDICPNCDDPFPKDSVVEVKDGPRSGSIAAEPGARAEVVGYGYYLRHTEQWIIVKWMRDWPGCNGQADGGYYPEDFILVGDNPVISRGRNAQHCSCEHPDTVENHALGKKFYVCRKCKRELNNA